MTTWPDGVGAADPAPDHPIRIRSFRRQETGAFAIAAPARATLKKSYRIKSVKEPHERVVRESQLRKSESYIRTPNGTNSASRASNFRDRRAIDPQLSVAIKYIMNLHGSRHNIAGPALFLQNFAAHPI
jgi:hypothetical protein